MARPIANTDYAVTTQGTDIDIHVLSNDSDPDGDSIEILRIRRAPRNGTAVLHNNRYVTYSPRPGWNGNDQFEYEIRDLPSSGSSRRARATCYITVQSQNPPSPPNAVDDHGGNTVENTPLDIATADLLVNDNDPDGDPLSIVSVQDAMNGTVVMNGAIITFTPSNNFAGTGSFKYTIDDGHGGQDSATVSVTIAPRVNTPPSAGSDAYTTSQNTNLDIPVSSLLANDTDADNDPLTVTSVQNGVNCSVAKNGNTVTVTPAPNYTGTAAFDYTVSDGQGATDTTNVTISVLQTNQNFWTNGQAHALQNKTTTFFTPPDIPSSTPGVLSDSSKQDFITYLSEIRALHGLTACQFDNGTYNYNVEHQASALYMAANQTLTHSPTPGNPCYSVDADTGAGEANLASTGRPAQALRLWMRDNGVSSAWELGHRTWILNPALIMTAYGEVNNFSSMRSRPHPSSSYNQPQVIACPHPGTDYPIDLFQGNWHYSDRSVNTYVNPVITVFEHGTGNIPVTLGFNGSSPYGNVRILAWYAAVSVGKTYDVTIQTNNLPDIHYSVNVIAIT